jgi:hypothetical protein
MPAVQDTVLDGVVVGDYYTPSMVEKPIRNPVILEALGI